MSTNDLCVLSIAQLAEQIQNKSVSPVEVTQAYLERIAAVDPKLNSYLTVTAERALKEARTAEAEIRANAYRGPLHGIPLAHKDIVATKGITTTCASKVLKDNVPDYDATVIDRLQAAGSVLLGKLNMNEFATMLPSQFRAGEQSVESCPHSWWIQQWLRRSRYRGTVCRFIRNRHWRLYPYPGSIL